MNAPISIWVPGTVRGKGRPRFVRASGRTYTPAQTVNYEAVLRMAGQAAMRSQPLFDGPVCIAMVAYFDIPASYSKKLRASCSVNETRPTKKPDWDNIAKLTDALNGIVWRDDCQITDATFTKRYASEPGLSIEVRHA